ncbi:MAG: hypothetical protein K2N03_08310 [Muribaculaceae bacterium]|nr:hypothetical protein [Muribaculaceae bacterium]
MMAKRLLGLILTAFVSIFVAKSQDLVFDGITPAPGSEISSFDFVLKFDLSKIIENNGQADYGVGWVGYHNDKRPTKEESVTIYKGDPADKIVIGRCCDDYYNGGDADFVPSSEVKISVPGAIPEPGVTYTMVICNEFEVYTKENGAKPYPNSLIDYFTNPITYTFTGAAVSAEKLNVASCSVSANQSIETLDEVVFTFSQSVSINSANPLVVNENDAVYATSTDAVLSDDKTTVTYKFDNLSLLLDHLYIISLPWGAVSSDANASETNNAFNVPVTGTSVGHFMLVSSIPNAEQKTIFSTVEGIFDMPEGMQIYKGPESALNLNGSLYKDTVAEENLVGILQGESNSTKNGIVWTNRFSLYPASTYVLYMPAGQFRARDIATGKLVNDWYNGEVNIILKTPSIEESGVPKVEFQAPVLGIYNANGNNVTLNNGDKINEITTIDFLYKDLRYSYNGEYVGATMTDTGSRSIDIYDITDDTPVLIKSAHLIQQTYETTTYYYSVYRATVNTPFFEGHKYKVVLPAGTFGATPTSIRNFSLNDEFAVEFEGATPSSVDLISCSLSDNVELSELSSVVWKFKGDFVKNPDSNVIFKSSSVGWELPTYVSTYLGTTTVQAFTCKSDGSPETFQNGKQSQLIFPEGLIYYAGDENIKNSEYIITITGVEKTPEVIKPEYVKLTVEVNGIANVQQQAVKGEIATFTLNPTDDWKVESVVGATQSAANTYKTLALTADTTVKVELAYEGAWAKEVWTNVYEIEAENSRIFKDGDNIIVEGAKPDQTICVYNIAGLLVNTANSEDGKDRVILTVSKNQEFYIVTVAGKAAKILMK